jgi:hypothetical protein
MTQALLDQMECLGALRGFCRRAKKPFFPLLCRYQGIQCEPFLPSFMTVFAHPQDLPSEWKPFEAGAKRVLLMAHLGANMQ